MLKGKKEKEWHAFPFIGIVQYSILLAQSAENYAIQPKKLLLLHVKYVEKQNIFT